MATNIHVHQSPPPHSWLPAFLLGLVLGLSPFLLALLDDRIVTDRGLNHSKPPVQGGPPSPPDERPAPPDHQVNQ